MNVLDRIHRDLADAKAKGDWARVIELRHELGKLLESTLNLVRQRTADEQRDEQAKLRPIPSSHETR